MNNAQFIKNSNGEVVSFYHGSPHKFNKFKINCRGGASDLGVHFAIDIKTAKAALLYRTLDKMSRDSEFIQDSEKRLKKAHNLMKGTPIKEVKLKGNIFKIGRDAGNFSRIDMVCNALREKGDGFYNNALEKYKFDHVKPLDKNIVDIIERKVGFKYPEDFDGESWMDENSVEMNEDTIATRKILIENNINVLLYPNTCDDGDNISVVVLDLNSIVCLA